MKQQSGFLLIIAIFIISIIAAVGATLAYVFTSTSLSTSKYYDGEQALYIANAGLERGLRTIVASGVECNDINSTFANPIDFANGQYQLSTVHYNPTPTSLSANIDANTTTIPANSTAGYAIRGRIMIDSEVIDYNGKTIHAFIDATRGKDGSTAEAHLNNTKISQNLCVLNSEGAVPNIANATATKKVQEGVFKGIYSVDRAAGNGGKIYHFDGTRWNLEATVGSSDLYYITCISGHNCWAMGLNGKIYHYNGSAWSEYQDIGSTHIFGGTCVAADDCWACGSSGRIYHFNGSSWSLNADVGSYDLAEISCAKKNDCWAVGVAGKIYHYNGSRWTYHSTVGSNTLYGLTCVTKDDCWASGSSGKIYHYDGHTWSLNRDVGSQILYEISCVTADDCWAMGEQGLVYHYNGSSWSLFQDVGYYPLRFAMCLNANDCWMVGHSGKIYHYNGHSWSEFQDVGPYDLQGVTARAIMQPISVLDWREVIN